MALQAVAADLARKFPGRAFTLFVWAGAAGDQAHFVSNAERDTVITAMKEIIDQGGPALPNGDRN